jgi:hypothetical protein
MVWWPALDAARRGAALKALRCGDCTSALVLAVDLFLDTHRWQTT